MDIEKNKTKFMAIGAIFIACLTAVFVYTLITTGDIKESLGRPLIFLGVNMVMPEPSADWGYFVIPMALLIYKTTGPEITRNKAVIIAYALSFPVGALVLLFAVLLLGKTRVWNSVQDGFNFLMSPIGMALAVLGFAILVVFFIVDFKLRKKIKTPQKRSYIRKKKRATKRVNVRR